MPLAPIAVTMGEPAGIGPEITLKAWAQRKACSPTFFLIDSIKRLVLLSKTLKLEIPFQTITSVGEAALVYKSALPVLERPEMQNLSFSLGTPDPATSKAVIASIDLAVKLVGDRQAAAIVTNPIQKATLQASGFAFPGHTEYFGHLAGSMRSVMMLTVERPQPPLRVVPVTVHEPIRKVAHLLTTEAIVHCGRVTAKALHHDFGIAQPRLAVAGLNPHAGESGEMGDEEIRIIAPALEQLRADGIDVRGPMPADTLFHDAARANYDAVLCMYHDQALVPLKTLDFAGGVNVTLGLPFVRTSPDHGTALDIATQGCADPTSFIAALDLAARIAARRAT